ncbi:hypothetical protein RF11_15134 [Thelohanellus kitauei]|uniref:ISXO2-like transposase domain-containing protein n=1 Tax=Thelohanellus kitauei TaxID=669202 RepID=A0A0C2MJ26_THEKT|nr:hypothetical protein RF11_15134 [Thelohanellus kitauei]
MEPITNFLNIFASEENCIHYLVECGVLMLPQIFLKCGFSNISLSSKSWRCTRKQFRLGHLICGTNCNFTVTHYKKFLRHLVRDSLDFIDFQIGGENVIVEIDETKMGKSKHYRGHSVNDAWVLGGVERIGERRLFLVEVSDSTEATINTFKDPEAGAHTSSIEGTWIALIPNSSMKQDQFPLRRWQCGRNVLNDHL